MVFNGHIWDGAETRMKLVFINVGTHASCILVEHNVLLHVANVH
jgi:hypothetical protein